MKQKNLFLFIFSIPFVVYANPLLVAVLMVKNEEPVMEMTLAPLVKAGIKDFLIYDTGSTDNTIQVTQQFFIKNNISNFVIEQGEWIDFATSRNHALELTERYFAQATFMLMLDAEWILHNGDDLLRYCKVHQYSPETLFFIQLKGQNIEFGHARLIRCRSNIHFVGKVHEIPNVDPQVRIPHHIYFELSPTHFGMEKSRSRWLRDEQILLEEIEKDPKNARAIMFLAQTYFCLNDLQNALKWYEQRLTLPGFEEEIFLANFSIAQVCAELGDEIKMVYFYLKSFQIRPHRADPLVRLAEYYFIKKSYHLCFMFAKAALIMPYPHQDSSLIEKWLYDFLRYDLVSKTACVVGDFKLGEQATLKAIEVCPNELYLYENLKYYRAALAQQGKVF